MGGTVDFGDSGAQQPVVGAGEEQVGGQHEFAARPTGPAADLRGGGHRQSQPLLPRHRPRGLRHARLEQRARRHAPGAGPPGARAGSATRSGCANTCSSWRASQLPSLVPHSAIRWTTRRSRSWPGSRRTRATSSAPVRRPAHNVPAQLIRNDRLAAPPSRRNLLRWLLFEGENDWAGLKAEWGRPSSRRGSIQGSTAWSSGKRGPLVPGARGGIQGLGEVDSRQVLDRVGVFQRRHIAADSRSTRSLLTRDQLLPRRYRVGRRWDRLSAIKTRAAPGRP